MEMRLVTNRPVTGGTGHGEGALSGRVERSMQGY
jgi:hypothetical protein